MNQDNIRVDGLVSQELGNSMFKVQLDSGHEILCTISGKIRKHYIRIMAGDKVSVEMSPYDLTKGRIVTRLQNPAQANKNESNKNNKFNQKKKN